MKSLLDAFKRTGIIKLLITNHPIVSLTTKLHVNVFVSPLLLSSIAFLLYLPPSHLFHFFQINNAPPPAINPPSSV